MVTKNIKTDYGAVGGGVTNDTSAFQTFRNAFQGSTVTLIIPNDSYNIDIDAHPFQGISDLTVNGFNSTLLHTVFYGGLGPSFIVANNPRIQTVTAGSQIVRLVTLADASLLSVNQWILIGGLDMQSGGQPQNLYFNEYHQISAINGGTGDITLDSPLRFGYKSTWPFYGNATSDSGGPGAIFPLPTTWKITQIYNDLIAQSNSSSDIMQAAGLAVTFNNFSCPNNIWPTQNRSFTANNSNFGTANSIEVDKLCETVTYNTCTAQQIGAISASAGKLILDNCIFASPTGINGTPREIILRNGTTLNNFNVGSSFGPSISAIITDSIFTGLTYTQNIFMLNAGTFLNGTFTVPKSSGAQPWAVPGSNLYYWDSNNNKNLYRAGRVLDIRENVSNTFIDTNIPYPMPLPSGADSLLMHPMTNITASGNTGSNDALDLNGLVGKPLFSQALASTHTYTGNFGTPTAWVMWGKLISLTVNVSRAYTGAQPTCMLQIFADMTRGDGITHFQYLGQINLKQLGTRIITPGSVVGTQTGDSALSIASGEWFQSGVNPSTTCNMSGDSAGQTPIVSIEMFTDQNFDLISSRGKNRWRNK